MRVVRLCKYLRDEHDWPVKSILLTTLARPTGPRRRRGSHVRGHANGARQPAVSNRHLAAGTEDRCRRSPTRRSRARSSRVIGTKRRVTPFKKKFHESTVDADRCLQRGRRGQVGRGVADRSSATSSQSSEEDLESGGEVARAGDAVARTVSARPPAVRHRGERIPTGGLSQYPGLDLQAITARSSSTASRRGARVSAGRAIKFRLWRCSRSVELGLGAEMHVVPAAPRLLLRLVGLGIDNFRGSAAIPSTLIVELGPTTGFGVSPSPPSRRISRRSSPAPVPASAPRSCYCGMEAPPLNGWDYTLGYYRLFPRLAIRHDVASVPFPLEGVALNPELNGADGDSPECGRVAPDR